MVNHDNRIGKFEGANIFDLCLAFVECDSTDKVHELQEVNHECVKWREVASGTFSVEVMMHGTHM